MRRTLAPHEFHQQLRDFAHTALRCEIQDCYNVPGEQEMVRRFMAGNPVPPPEDEGARPWLDQIAQQAAAGKRIKRVRVHHDPPTNYQKWLRWAGKWNIGAGEEIVYFTAPVARRIGLISVVAQRDWWLFDDNRLMVMTHNEQGKRIHTELVTDENQLELARTWWALAEAATTRGENNDG